MAESSLSDIFERTWRKRSPLWKAYALRLTRRPADADDVVLEATTRTLQTQPDLDSEGRVHAYMTTAIRHIAFDVVRKRGREVAFDEGKTEVGRTYASSALQLAMSEEAREQRTSLGVVLKGELVRLPKKHRDVIEMIVLRTPPMKLREVAALQGVATSTVHYRLRRGLDALARALERARAGHGTIP